MKFLITDSLYELISVLCQHIWLLEMVIAFSGLLRIFYSAVMKKDICDDSSKTINIKIALTRYGNSELNGSDLQAKLTVNKERLTKQTYWK